MIFKKQVQAEEILKSEKEKLKNAEYWISFLKTSAMQYKHDWNTQIAIHQAMPESIACTEAKIWKENGCTLIDTSNAVITERDGKICRLFDISQVSGEFTKSYWIWKVHDDELNVDYSEALNDTLCSRYKLDSETLAETIYNISLEKTASVIDKNSDVYNVISESVAYTVIQRCCPDEVEMSYDNIDSILETVSIDKIGTAVTSLAKNMLMEIEKIVKNERTAEIDRRGLDEYNREHIDKRNEMRIQSKQEKILPDNQDSGRENLHTERKDIPLHSDSESGVRPQFDNSSTASELSEESGGTGEEKPSVLNSSPMANNNNNIIGNTTYKYIPQKSYRKYDIDIAMKISEKLESENIKYSGKIADDTVTFTVSKPDVSKLEEIAEKIKEDLDFTFEADTKKFANGELSTADKSVGFKPYIIADLKTWTNNSPERSKLERYETLDEAFKRFDELRNEPYNSEIALHKQDNFPMARLTLGVESSDGEYAFDVIHVRAGQNYLCDDFTRIPDVFANKNFSDILTNVSENITIDRIAIYEKDENGNYKDTPEDVAFNDVKSKELFTELGKEYSKLIPDNNEKSFAEQIDDVLSGTANRYDDIKVCDTPQILLDCGLQQLPMLYTKRHLKKALEPKDLRKHNHGLTTEQIKKIPFLLENPVIIYDSLNRNDSIIVLTSEIDDYNEPIIVSIQTNGKGVYHLERVDSNFITSIYGRENIDKQLTYAAEQDKILFIDKTKSQDLFSVLRLQFSEGLNNLDSNIIIHQSRNIVNTNAEKTVEISDEIFKEAIYPSLASDEWTAITTEFFSYETAWHNVDEKISSLAKRYRSGENITEELGQYFGVGRNLGTSLDDKKFILDRNENSVKITHIQSNHSAEYTWSDIGSIQLQMLKERFKEDTLDAIREYPDTAAINNRYIERMESENYPEKESTEKLMPIVIEKYGLEIDFNEIEDITFEIGENLSIICFYSKENTLFRDESGVNSSLSPVEALSSATDEIEKLFDMSVNNPDIKIFINHKDNTQQLLNPEKMREDVLKNRISESDKIIENLENTLKELQPENKLELEIGFSESGEIERFKSEYLNGEPMSYALGNALLEYLDEKQHTEREIGELNVGWYHKTDFNIKAVINGEDYGYNGRYDIGDGKDGGNGSLSEHIRQYNEYAVTNNPYHLTDEELEERLEILNVFVPFLKENSVLNEKEQQILDTYISENPVRTEINLENHSDNSKDTIYRIYQLKTGEEYHYARFSSLDSNIEHDIQLNKDDYDLVYEGNLSDINGSSIEDKLSKIYEIFNINHPRDFRGRSLSVSDIITVDDTNAYYVDSFGFKDFPAFFLEKTITIEHTNSPMANNYNSDKFYENRDTQSVTWMYYNPDGNDGQGQFIETVIYKEDIENAINKANSSRNSTQAFVDTFYNCTQTITDRGTENFPAAEKYYNEAESDFAVEGNSKNVFSEIRNYLTDYYNSFDKIKNIVEQNTVEQISLFDMPENTSEITEESKEIVWTPITETADDNGKPTSYSTLYKGERYWITQVDKYKFDIEYDTTNGIQAINDDFSGFSSRTQAEEFFEDEIDDFLELTQTHSELETSKNDIAENDYSPMANNKNYHIETDNFELGGEKSKFKANVEAIRTMKAIESENRTATHEEMEIMSKYTGWGGLQNAFDNRKDNWSNEYAELKNLLTEDEYLSAKASVLDSFYTPPFVIDSIYRALENMGFEGGKILDPATGVGNFLGKMPEKISAKSEITAVEKDSISGRIAKALYPEAKINISGFEDTVYPDNTFDVAVGNIPFGDFKLSDRNYDKHNFMIHDYFFAKAIDKVHSGGIIAFITSKGTLDKSNQKVRKYISERADLIGAIRLPNNTFKSYAGTEVTSDIIFLQKREELNDIAPDWVYTDIDDNGFSVNSYFAAHPEMILGKTVEGNKLYGSKDTMVVPFENSDLKELLNKAIDNIKGEYKNITVKKEKTEKIKNIIPANPKIQNYSFAEIDGKIYYREDNVMTLQKLSGKRLVRMKGMCKISMQVHKLLDMQLEGYPEEVLQTERDKLNHIYDRFTSEHGLLNEKANADLFYKDVSAPLLLSLEQIKDGKLEEKSAIFTKTTLKPPEVITHTESSQDALIVSISEKACVDIKFMQKLTDKSEAELYNDLKGDIFKDPLSEGNYITADEYLSGNIREKLKTAKLAAENSGEFEVNVMALEKAMPVPLEAGEIAAQLGSSWIDTKYIEQFIREKLDIKDKFIDVKVHHNKYTASWNIENKSALTHSSRIKSTEEYGTSRKSAAEIIENSLNMRDTSVYDVVYNPETEKEERVLNHDETLLARQKQTTLQNEFKDWIFNDSVRRNALVEKYNVLYNSVRQRQYNGENLIFGGMTTDIQMKPHQKDAIAHALYGGNTLFAHKVGAGKTFEMIATAMEGKRLGLHSKSLIAVPNHMTRQFANDFFKLYPNANILVAEEKDFAKDNRRQLTAKIATGDFDAVIIGHSQLIKIPISREREEAYISKEIEAVVAQIEDMKSQKGDSFTIKDMERVRKNLQTKLDKLLSKPVRDNVVTFEQLGVDKLIIDEADMFKNLFISTKMNNLSGVATNENVQKTQDLFMKCQYLNEITDGKGIVFATGTPISNSISEAYVMQKYLNPKALDEAGLSHFDAWAANFAQKVTRTEFSPDGRGFRTKTRLAKFNNLPELMSMFKDFTDIKMAEDLNLPEPECERHTISVEATPVQKDLMQSLGERAEMIHNKMVRPDIDNMLKITTDGTKIGLDQRLIDPILPDDPNSKVNTCINNVFKIYNDTKAERLTQVIFCDYSTPKADGSFSIYDDIRKKLIEKGVPENEVAFIHDCRNNRQKEALFAKVRSGDVRIILGSTQKMGAGTNIQTKLYALHHLDPTWKPRDMEQRLGRMKRQGNENEKVHEYIYVTKDTFDANRYQTLEIKQGYISQIMTNHNPIRSCDDISPEEMSFAEVKAACVGNPLIKEKMELDIDIAQLQSLKSSYLKSHYRLEDSINAMPKKIANELKLYENAVKDEAIANAHPVIKDSEGNSIFSGITINGEYYSDKKQAGEALIAYSGKALIQNDYKETPIGEYRGFKLVLWFDSVFKETKLDICGNNKYSITLSQSEIGNMTRIENAVNNIGSRAVEYKTSAESMDKELTEAKLEFEKPFPQEQELKDKIARQSFLERELSKENEDVMIDKNDKSNDNIQKNQQKEQERSIQAQKNKNAVEL